MLGNVDGRTIAAEIRMARMDKHKKAFLIVEGLNDLKALSRFVDSEQCSVINGIKKDNVIEALGLLEDDGVFGVCALVDQDYDAILGISHDLENLISTEFHDLDVVIFKSAALDRVLMEYADGGKLQSFQEKTGKSIRDYILSVAAEIGGSRLASAKFKLDIYFSDLEYDKIIDVLSLTVDSGLCEYLCLRSRTVECDRLASLSKEIRRKDYQLEILCQGHDICAILGLAFRSVIGSRTVQQSYGGEMEKVLRLSFDADIFRKTVLFENLLSWERKNSPWKLLLSV